MFTCHSCLLMICRRRYIGPENTNYATCKQDGPNPDNGVISFDNFYMAFVSIFVVLTMEGWTEVMYKVSACHVQPQVDVY